MKTKKTMHAMVLCGIFTALTVLSVMIHIPIPLTNGGYVHLGDTIVYLAASCLSPLYACFAAGVGSALADVFAGAAIWAPATFAVKCLLALTFTYKKETFLCLRNILAVVAGLLITAGGYYVAEALLFGDWIVPLLSVWGNVLQAVGSGVLYVLIALVFDRMGLKRKGIL